MFRIKSILAIVGLILLSGCASKPLSLSIAVNDIYCTDTACFCVHDVAARRYFQTLEILKQDKNIELELVYFTEPYQLEEAICSGKYDGVLSKPWTALRLQKESGTSFYRIADLLDPNNNQWLSGIVIVPTGSPVQSLEELNGKHIYLGESDAYEKHQAAKALFKQRGIKPSKIDTNASCSENIGVLLDEEADAAVISDYALSADCAVDFANPEDFRVLEHTEQIPLTSLMVDLNKVSMGDADRLQKALLALSGPDAPESLLSNGFIPPAPWAPPELEKQP
jgi:ABC-type phosphate/phosphonate transport system substrate-binding protein